MPRFTNIAVFFYNSVQRGEGVSNPWSSIAIIAKAALHILPEKRQEDKKTRRQEDKKTRRQEDKKTRRQKDKETEGWGSKATCAMPK